MKRSRSPSPTLPTAAPLFPDGALHIHSLLECDRSGTYLREQMESHWKDTNERPATWLLCGWLVLGVPDWTTRQVEVVHPTFSCRTDIFMVYWSVPAVGSGSGEDMIVAFVECDGEVSVQTPTNMPINSELETHVREQSRAVLERPEYREFVRKQRDWKRDVAQIARLLDNLTIEEAIAALRNRGY